MKQTKKHLSHFVKVIALLGLVFTGLGLSFESPAIAAESFNRQAKRFVRPYLRGQRSHAYSIGIYKDGQEFVAGYGQLSEDNSKKPNGDTLYQIGSITKVFTGILLADAVVKKEVRLDQPAGDLLPDGIGMPKHADEQILLRDLSTHVSVLPRLPTNLITKNRLDPYKHYSQEMLFDFLNSHELRHPPRTQWEYSNLGAGLLAELLAIKNKTDFSSLLNNSISEPLGLSDTIVQLNEEQEGRLAPPHRSDLEPSICWQFPVFAGAGAAFSSVNDLLRFGRAVLDPPQGSIGKAINLAWEVHQQSLEGEQHTMCLGWQLSSDKTTRYHSGRVAGYRASLFVSRKHNLVVVVLSNAKKGGSPELATKLFRAAIGIDEKPDKIDRPATVPRAVMDRYVGRYKTPKGGIYTVERKGEKLMVRFNEQASYRVFSTSKTEWSYRNYETVLKFDPAPSGPCPSVEIETTSKTFSAERIN